MSKVRRRVGRLSDRQAKSAKPRPGREWDLLADGGNLYLQLSTGSGGEINRSWVFRYEQDFRRHELGLGSLLTISLAEARTKARHLRQQLLDGIDPLEAKRELKRQRQARKAEQAKAVTFRQCTEMYLAAHSDGWKNRKHRAQWGSTLKTYAFPTMADLAVADIETAHVVKVLEPIWKRVPETASRLRARIESVLGFATVRGYRTGDNAARWKGHLAEVLPARGKIRKPKHHAALPYTELPAFMAELRKRDSLSARALEFTILAVARTGETIGATYDEFDFKTRTWTIGESRMKAGKEHRVPLSARALEILAGLPRHGERVFPLRSMAMLELLRGIRPGMTVHGFRSCFMDWAHERTGYPKVVIDMALAHKVGDKVEAAYRRGDLFEKRRQLVAEWDRYCARPLPATGAAVASIGGRR